MSGHSHRSLEDTAMELGDSDNGQDDCGAADSTAGSDTGSDVMSACVDFDSSKRRLFIQSPMKEFDARRGVPAAPLRCVFQMPGRGRSSNVVEMLAVQAINGTPAVACASATSAAIDSLTTSAHPPPRSAVAPASPLDDTNSSETRLLQVRRQGVADLGELGGLPAPAPSTGSRLPGYRRRFKPNIGYRLGRRRLVTERRKRLCDYSLVCAAFGLVAMIVETELSMADVYDKVSTPLSN